MPLKSEAVPMETDCAVNVTVSMPNSNLQSDPSYAEVRTYGSVTVQIGPDYLFGLQRSGIRMKQIHKSVEI